MPNNVQQYHVSGEAPISVGTGSAGALEVLGVSKDGVTINEVFKERASMSDVGGSESPVDFQDMGSEAYIDLTLIAWTENILRKLRNRPYVQPNGTVFTPGDGVAVPRGQLLGTNGRAFSCAIGAQYEDPWLFTTCKILGQPFSVRAGTNQMECKIRLHAWVFIPGNLTSLAALATNALPKLYQRSLS
jgi:hypothetical protein